MVKLLTAKNFRMKKPWLPVTQIVKVGTAKPSMVPSDAPKTDALPEYPLTYTDEIRVEKIAFNIEEQYTDELIRDARQITTPGVEGERTIKTRVYSSNGQRLTAKSCLMRKLWRP